MDNPVQRGQSFLDQEAGRIASQSEKTSWQDPKPIESELRPVVKFDPDVLLPEAFRVWVSDEADRMPCPPDYVAATALVAIGSVVGARCAIQPKASDTWLVIPNLWGGVIGEPSAKKSPAISAGMKPVDHLVSKAIEIHKVDLEAFESEKIVYEAKTEALESRLKTAAKNPEKGNLDTIALELKEHKSNAPQEPKVRRFKSNDTTVEKLGEILVENPNGILVLRDELVGLLSNWDRDGREGERAFYLESWNGNAGFDTDRIGRGSINIPNLCTSIFGGIQPDKLTSYLEQASHSLANDGLIQRFQVMVFPDHHAWEWRDRLPNIEARKKVYELFEMIAKFDPIEWGASSGDEFTKFPFFRFSEPAQQIFIKWSSDLHLQKIPQESSPLMVQHLAKFDKLFPAMALILHLVECASTGRRGPVTEEAALRAAAWTEYLESHARRVYGLLADEGLRAAQALSKRLRESKLSDGFTARDVRRNQWRYLTEEGAVAAALTWLEDEGWIRGELVGGGGQGRPTTRYQINPKIQSKKDGE